eukprot:Skav230305  [mRNA]  locus=scaffold430:57884:59243:+ [translate_table: standard]
MKEEEEEVDDEAPQRSEAIRPSRRGLRKMPGMQDRRAGSCAAERLTMAHLPGEAPRLKPAQDIVVAKLSTAKDSYQERKLLWKEANEAQSGTDVVALMVS